MGRVELGVEPPVRSARPSTGGAVVIERDGYGDGAHRWSTELIVRAEARCHAVAA